MHFPFFFGNIIAGSEILILVANLGVFEHRRVVDAQFAGNGLNETSPVDWDHGEAASENAKLFNGAQYVVTK